MELHLLDKGCRRGRVAPLPPATLIFGGAVDYSGTQDRASTLASLACIPLSGVSGRGPT